jgi:hypothetical protein
VSEKGAARMARKVRGPYHERLRAALMEATQFPGCDQTSLAEALQRDQSGLSKYLRNVAGTLDLDEADRALRHCGLGGLMEFVTKTPPRDDGVPPRLLAFLRENDDFRQLLTDVLDVPRARHSEILAILQPVVRALRRVPKVGRPPGTSGARRTKVG